MTTYSKISKICLTRRKARKLTGPASTTGMKLSAITELRGTVTNSPTMRLLVRHLVRVSQKREMPIRTVITMRTKTAASILDQKFFSVYLKIVRSETVWISTLTV